MHLSKIPIGYALKSVASLVFLIVLISVSSSYTYGQTGEIYWTDTRGIHKANTDGSNPETLIEVIVAIPTEVVLDNRAGKIYWTDASLKKIKRANLDGTDIEDIISVGLSGPEGIALDLDAGKLYVTDTDFTDGRILRANLDGSGVEELIVYSEDLNSLPDIAIDRESGYLFWADKGTRTIQRVSIDGSIREIIVNTAPADPGGVTVNEQTGKIYWTEYMFGSPSRVLRADLDGANTEELVSQDDMRFFLDITLDIPSGKMYWLNSGFVQRANLDGSEVEEFAYFGLENPDALAYDAQSEVLYITDRGAAKLVRYTLADATVEDVITSPLIAPGGLALDVLGGKMYWTSIITDSIQRANLDGSGIEGLVISGLVAPRDIELDLNARKMYWADRISTGNIFRANLDGSDTEEVVTSLSRPKGLALNSDAGTMYIADEGFNRIHRSNLDGPEFESIVEFFLETPRAIALDVENRTMYWSERSTIQRASMDIQNGNADGSEAEIVHNGLFHSEGLALDLINRKMYWSDRNLNTIERANLDGSEVEELPIPNLLRPLDIEIVPALRTATEDQKIPVTTRWALSAPYPNPFKSITTFTYQLAESGDLQVRVFDVLGRWVRDLNQGEASAGESKITWDGHNAEGADVPAGVYFIHVSFDQVLTEIKTVVKVE